MLCIRSSAYVAAVLALGTTALFPATSHATSIAYYQTSDDSSGQTLGGTGPFDANNYITVTDSATGLAAGSLQISVHLDTGWGLVNTGVATNGSLVWGLTNIGSLTFTAVAPTPFNSTTSTGWVPTGATTPAAGSSSVSVNSAYLSEPGKYAYEITVPGHPATTAATGYGMTYEASGGSNPFTGLTFDITKSGGLTLTAFETALESSTNSKSAAGSCLVSITLGCFYADVIGANGNTGLIDFGFTKESQQSTVPLPAALPLFAGGLGFLGLLGLRRRRTA